jgi:sporulation protein YlmC with PRC-barrel domain
MARGKRTIEIEDLVGGRVVDAEGRTLGHVVDVLVTGLPRPEVVALALGAGAWLARLEVDSPLLRLLRRSRRVKVVPWRHVDAVEDRRMIKLKPGWEAESEEIDVDEPVVRQERSQDRRRATR